MKNKKKTIVEKNFFPNFISKSPWPVLVAMVATLWVTFAFGSIFFNSDGSFDEPVLSLTALFGGMIFFSFLPTRPTLRWDFLILFISLFLGLVLVLVKYHGIVDWIVPSKLTPSYLAIIYKAFVLALIITFIKGFLLLFRKLTRLIF